MDLEKKESPEYVQTSKAGALALGLQNGSFYRDARLHCLNLLLTYADGCKANCAFCGLGREREHYGQAHEKTFIRVEWPIYSIEVIVQALSTSKCDDIERVCISMVTHKGAREHTINIVRGIEESGKPISVLLCPTVINKSWLEMLHETTVDKVGIAIDAATPELFDAHRGKHVNGPHDWGRYWKTLMDSIDIFGPRNTGVHLIVGLGETEAQMMKTIQEVHDLGSITHLFSFFPEKGSKLESHPQPAIGTYRRIQLAREAIWRDMTTFEKMEFNNKGQLVDFGVPDGALDALIGDGIAFLTQGCTDSSGNMVCNRPYSNCTPFQASKGELRNFPFPPEKDDLAMIKAQLRDYDPDSWVRTLSETEDFLIK